MKVLLFKDTIMLLNMACDVRSLVIGLRYTNVEHSF
jgi:hypothetical protein